MTIKRRVFLDGNGSSQINVEGLGVFVTAIVHDYIKQNLSAEIQQLKDQVNSMTVDLGIAVKAAETINRDKLRLDLLDTVNAEFNKRNGTIYGWAVDWNHNRISLRDSDPMKKSVRQAIDDFESRIKKAGK